MVQCVSCERFDLRSSKLSRRGLGHCGLDLARNPKTGVYWDATTEHPCESFEQSDKAGDRLAWLHKHRGRS